MSDPCSAAAHELCAEDMTQHWKGSQNDALHCSSADGKCATAVQAAEAALLALQLSRHKPGGPASNMATPKGCPVSSVCGKTTTLCPCLLSGTVAGVTVCVCARLLLQIPG